MWSDNETDVDLLGFQVHSDLIQSVVTDVNLLPVTVGVFGDWGSGKSSVMRMLMRDLKARDDIACIYFNGWQFEGYDDAKSALIHSILLELGEHQKLTPKIKDKVASLLKQIDWLRLANIGYQTVIAPVIAHQLAMMLGTPAPGTAVPVPMTVPGQKGLSSEADLTELAEVDLTELVKENPANSGVIGARRFRKDFEDLIADTNLTSLVVLIDDLDRCEPERLVETLEAIKLFLAVPHVAFVIGADERIVRYAIAKRYETGRVEAEEGRTDRHVDLVTDYLEKLIQIPYHLPRLSPSEIETYMSLLFCQRHLQDDFDAVHKAFLKAREDNMSATFGHQQIKEILSQEEFPVDLKAELAWCSSIAPALSDVLKGNPRQTKRLLNALLLRRKLALAAHLDISDQILVKLMLLEYIRPDLFGQLYQWQAAQQGVPKQLEALEHGVDGDNRVFVKLANEVLEREPDWKEENVKTWLQMPPSLAGEDLRDYFWVTRDRVTSILAGVPLVPPHIRRLLSNLLEAEPGAMPETKRQIGQLPSDEQGMLLQELARQLQREPERYQLVNVWIDLADVAPMAPHRLVTALGQIPPSPLSGVIPMKLVDMAQQHPDVRDRIEALLHKWQQEENTLIGKAAQDALETLREDST